MPTADEHPEGQAGLVRPLPEPETVQERAARGEPDAVARMEVLAELEGNSLTSTEALPPLPRRKPLVKEAALDNAMAGLGDVRRILLTWPDNQSVVAARHLVDDALLLVVEAMVETDR